MVLKKLCFMSMHVSEVEMVTKYTPHCNDLVFTENRTDIRFC